MILPSTVSIVLKPQYATHLNEEQLYSGGVRKGQHVANTSVPHFICYLIEFHIQTLLNRYLPF
jgi:hypothetical protein